MRSCALACFLAACGSGEPVDATCAPAVVYLNRTGGTYNPGPRDDAANHVSVLVAAPQTVAAWPHDEVNWREVLDCIDVALRPFPITVTELDPGGVARNEIVFTDAYWAGPTGTTMIVPASCVPGHQIEFVFGDALTTSARACHVAMQGFAEMTASLSLGDNCADFVNNAIDCTPTRGFLDLTVNCVDAANQPAACRCGAATTENTYAALAATFAQCR